MNREWLRKTCYLVAGILPALGYGVFSLMALATPWLLWPVAAWVGIAGLFRAWKSPPRYQLHRLTSLMVLSGLVAMLPITIQLMASGLADHLGRFNVEAVGWLLTSLGPVLVALHFLYSQLALILENLLCGLRPA